MEGFLNRSSIRHYAKPLRVCDISNLSEEYIIALK